ncbi:hypothetical protein BHK69_31080 (plasmid) [Bosea vaviloviae]|uniref:Uncharacterized protein n=2 Tax=Bosea vaviloviae TaxID=1526658 RepID=A0A1D7UCN4_9HYPH|nr:hypothetical protein BHK69_31080 [Bosea vaviloviae]
MTLADPALALSQAWTEARAATAAQCLKQQRLETALLERRRSSEGVDGKPASRAGYRDGMRRAYAEAKAAEALAAAHEQELLERLAGAPANSLAGIAAKLSVIAIEAEDNTDLTDFPVPHVRSALEDLRRLMGRTILDSCPAPESDREEVGRTDLCRAQRQAIQRER